MDEPSHPRRRRKLGCLPQVALALGFGLVLYMAVEAALYPWIYVVGGRLRPWPVWQGAGVANGPAGAYRIHVWFSPVPRSSRILPSTNVEGYGYLCTPRGERYSLRVTGGTRGIVWRDMDGRPFALYARHRPWNWRLTTYETWRPQLEFSGRWAGPNLVMDDGGSFAHAFLPDGTLNTKAGTWHPKTGAVPVTLTETSWSPFGSKCPAPAG